MTVEVGLGVALLLVVAGIAIILSLRRAASRPVCSSCGRARVRGVQVCPTCGRPYGDELYRTRFDRSPSPPPGTAPWLACIEGPAVGQNFPISSSEYTIGRSTDNSLPLEAGLVSRHHAVLTLQDGRFVLYDRDSLNGTWVNGQRIVQHALQSGDQVQIGPFVLLFQATDSAVAPQSVIQPEERLPTPAPVAARSVDLGNYALMETLGGGGMASVYRAVSRLDGSVVAIKVFHQQIDDPFLLEKFQQEVRIGQQLSEPVPHPHIARVFGGGQHEGSYFMVEELVDSRSLRERLVPGQPMAYEYIVPIIGQTCDALHHAHQRGVFHRDIKPENIMFASHGGVKLVDFGIAKVAGQPTRTMDGMLIGTPCYMSYEQAQGDRIDARSDIYSLGVVLYEMLTGRPPFTGEALTVVHKHIAEEPMRPRQLNPGLAPGVESVVMRALAKNREKRLQTVEEMARALGYTQPFFTGGTQPARPSGREAPARLVILHTGQVLPVAESPMVLQRRLVNPSDDKISREHARIVANGEQFWLEDRGSTNGTFLNERRIFEAAPLRRGDVIRIGRTQLRFDQVRH